VKHGLLWSNLVTSFGGLMHIVLRDDFLVRCTCNCDANAETFERCYQRYVVRTSGELVLAVRSHRL
jgi:hypothetical protein